MGRRMIPAARSGEERHRQSDHRSAKAEENTKARQGENAKGHFVLALTPGPSPNNWARGDRIGPVAGSPSPSFWERGLGGEGLSAGNEISLGKRKGEQTFDKEPMNEGGF